jgi:hypothetical protein
MKPHITLITLGILTITCARWRGTPDSISRIESASRFDPT